MLKFTKMHGIGNDYIVFNAINNHLNLTEQQIKFLCDRRFGIGADGVLYVLPGEKADLRMRMFNPDGSEAQMCGNGIRCFAKFAVENGIVNKSDLTVETLAGIKHLLVKSDSITCNMGPPLKVTAKQYSKATGDNLFEQASINGYNATIVSVGNPHCVIVVDNVDSFPVQIKGPKIETNKLFPEKINVEFVQLVNKKLVKQRTWERGAGETLGCGTGACAVFWALYSQKKCSNPLKIELLGGPLQISIDKSGNLLMEGEAKTVFPGEIDI